MEDNIRVRARARLADGRIVGWRAKETVTDLPTQIPQQKPTGTKQETHMKTLRRLQTLGTYDQSDEHHSTFRKP